MVLKEPKRIGRMGGRPAARAAHFYCDKVLLMKKPESICVFGDSTAWGAWDLEKGGWVSRLWLYVGKRDEAYVEIYNQSINGGTSETILKRFEDEARIRAADALIFQTGVNDAAYTKNDPNSLTVQPDTFRGNILEIIARAKKITHKIIFIGLKNCDESKTMPVSWVDFYYTNENFATYNKILEEVCREQKIPFLDVGLLKNEDFDDGLHPNAEGHRKIFEKVKDFLLKQAWI